MNFKGRYWTVNGTLVAVHENTEATEGDREIRWKGHYIRVNPSFMQRYDISLTLWWNENGENVKWVDCVGKVGFGGEFDLMKLANPQSLESQIDIPDCPQCQSEKWEKLGVPFDGKVPEYVNAAFLKVWDWAVGKPGMIRSCLEI